MLNSQQHQQIDISFMAGSWLRPYSLAHTECEIEWLYRGCRVPVHGGTLPAGRTPDSGQGLRTAEASSGARGNTGGGTCRPAGGRPVGRTSPGPCSHCPARYTSRPVPTRRRRQHRDAAATAGVGARTRTDRRGRRRGGTASSVQVWVRHTKLQSAGSFGLHGTWIRCSAASGSRAWNVRVSLCTV